MQSTQRAHAIRRAQARRIVFLCSLALLSAAMAALGGCATAISPATPASASGSDAASSPAAPASQTPAAGPHYAHLFGRRYRTVVELQVLEARFDYRYLARADDSRVAALGPVKTLARVPAGAELELVAETHETNPASGVRARGGYPMGLIAVLRFGGKSIDGVLTEFIQRADLAPPRTPNQEIDPAVAVPLERFAVSDNARASSHAISP